MEKKSYGKRERKTIVWLAVIFFIISFILFFLKIGTIFFMAYRLPNVITYEYLIILWLLYGTYLFFS